MDDDGGGALSSDDDDALCFVFVPREGIPLTLSGAGDAHAGAHAPTRLARTSTRSVACTAREKGGPIWLGGLRGATVLGVAEPLHLPALGFILGYWHSVLGGPIAPALKAQPVIFVSIAAVFNILVRSYEAPIVTAVSEETSRNFVPATAAAPFVRVMMSVSPLMPMAFAVNRTLSTSTYPFVLVIASPVVPECVRDAAVFDIVMSSARVAAPVTARVLDSVAAPLTPKVLDSVVAPLAARVPVTLAPPAATVMTVAAVATPMLAPVNRTLSTST